MSGFIGPKPTDVPVGTIATKGTLSGNNLVISSNNATIGNSFYVTANGNVGVGTSPSPWGSTFRAIQLPSGSVSGTSTNFAIGTNSYRDSTQWTYVNSDYATLYQHSGGGHYWYSANSGTAGNPITWNNTMFLGSNGNLGIGTTTPAAYGKVAIYDATLSTFTLLGDNNTSFSVRRHSTDVFGPTHTSVKSRGTAASPTTVANGDQAWAMNNFAHDGTTGRAITSIQSYIDTLTGTDDVSGYLSFQTRPTGAAATLQERMRIVANGNVGISWTSPQATLHIGGDIIASSLRTNANNNSLELYSGNTFNTNGDAAISIRGSASGYNDGGIEFYAGGSEKMRIAANGNIGTGFVQPQTKLHIKNLSTETAPVIRLDNANNNLTTDQQIGGLEVYSADGSGPGAGIRGSVRVMSNDATGTSTYMKFSVANTSSSDVEAMRIYGGTTGVCIGTTTLTSKLSISDVGGEVFYAQGTTAANYSRMRVFNDAGVGFAAITYGSTYSGGSVVGVGSNGTVIGTTGGNLGFAPKSGSSILFGGDAGSAGTERMRVDPNGYLLLGYTTSQGTYKLQVTGGAGLAGATAWTSLSDRRLKNNIIPITDGLEKIMLLKPVDYTYINAEDHSDPREYGGFIAQDVKEVFPEFVTKNSTPSGSDKDLLDEDGKAYDLTLTNKFHAYVVAAIQELTKRVEELEAKQG